MRAKKYTKPRMDMENRLPQLNHRGETVFHRKLSNEEILERGKEKYGSISLRVSFTVRDSDGQYKALRGKTITVKKVRDAETVYEVIERMEGSIRR